MAWPRVATAFRRTITFKATVRHGWAALACLGLLFLLPAYLWELVQVGGFAVNGLVERDKIIYGGLVELIVNAMVDIKQPFIKWEEQ